VAAYREAMAGFAQMGTMEVWYAHLAEDDLMQRLRDAASAANKKAKKEAIQAEKALRKGARQGAHP
jgi:hypothetical protein